MSTPELTDDSPAPAGEVGELIRRFRYRLGMTQQELADFSTVSVRAIRDLERGATQQPRRETLRLIADALRLDGEAVAAIDEAAGRELGEAGRTRGGHAPTSVGGLIGADVFLGREDVIALLRSRLWDHGDRVVGLTGAPGVGKSRLATELAAGTSGGMVLWHDVPGDRPLARHTRSGSVVSRAVQAVHRGGRAKPGTV